MPKTKDASSTSRDVGDLPKYDSDERSLVDVLDSPDPTTKRAVNVRVVARQGESSEQMLRRFNYATQDVVEHTREIQRFEKPSKRRRKDEKLRIQQIKRYERLNG